MKKIILFTVCCLLFSTIAFSADLVCDPDPDFVKFEIEGIAPDKVTVDAVEHALKYNLDIVPPGDYSITVRAINSWEEKSESVPLSFQRPASNPPKNLRVVSP